MSLQFAQENEDNSSGVSVMRLFFIVLLKNAADHSVQSCFDSVCVSAMTLHPNCHLHNISIQRLQKCRDCNAWSRKGSTFQTSQYFPCLAYSMTKQCQSFILSRNSFREFSSWMNCSKLQTRAVYMVPKSPQTNQKLGRINSAVRSALIMKYVFSHCLRGDPLFEQIFWIKYSVCRGGTTYLWKFHD